MTYDRTKLITFGTSTLSGVVAAVVILIVVNASFLKAPGNPPPASASRAGEGQPAPIAEPDYKSIAERNLFRAQLQIEIPKPKTEAELEEEALNAIVNTMALRGVVLSPRKHDNYAVIDRGGQKGVWVYEKGEVIERGLEVKDIRRDLVRVGKGDFEVVLRLFSAAVERTPRLRAANTPATPKPAARKIDLRGEIKKEGSITRISKSLAEKLKSDNNMIMSSIAVKPAPDGVKVVAVDQGSIAQKMGIAPNDTLQEVNGHRLSSTADMNEIYESLKNATDFEVKVLRRGKSETLRYQIR